MATASEDLQDPTNALPYEVSSVIFSFIPAQDLVKNCVLVCHLWKGIVDAQTTWRLKCERSGRFRAKYMKSFEPDDWKSYYYKNPYTRNLLKNPNLSDAFPNIVEAKSKILHSWSGYGELTADQWNAQFEPWEMVEIGGDGLRIECPPIGCCEAPSKYIGVKSESKVNYGKSNVVQKMFERVGWSGGARIFKVGGRKGSTGKESTLTKGESCCIATSYGSTIKCQIVDLVAQGVSEYVLDECKLPIQVYEWVNSRFDCGCKYYMKVTLKDKRQNKIPGFKIKLEGQKPGGKHEWEKLEHIFRDYPPGVRYVQFKDYGQDTAYWAGYYGAKFSGATVKFLFD